MKREAFEEVGLNIHVGSPVHVGEWRPHVSSETWQIIGIYFLCGSNTRDVRLGEDHSAYQWIDLATYDDYPIIDDLGKAFKALIDHLEST